MGNLFVAAIISLFFLKRTTKDTREKINTANKYKVLIYFVLMIVVGIFFYKTCQIATINNIVQVDVLKSRCDSNGLFVDSIETLEIFNRFSSMGTYKNAVLDQVKNQSKENNEYLTKGGLRFELRTKTKTNGGYTYNNELGFKDYEIDRLVPQRVNSYTNLYKIELIADVVPKLFPFSQGMESVSDYKISKNGFKKKSVVSTRNNKGLYLNIDKGLNQYNQTPEKETIDFEIENGFVFNEIFGIINSDTIKEPAVSIIDCITAEYLNTFNIFTAADVTQFSYCIHINSTIPINNVYVDFNVPIETPVLRNYMQVGTRGIIIRDELLHDMLEHTVVMHIKLPSLENLQLIRSLILTTLLTALVALFFSNSYYLFSKWLLKKRRRKTLPISTLRRISRNRVKFFRNFVFFLSVIISVILIGGVILILIDKPILVYKKDVWTYVIAALLILSLLIYMVYRAHRFARTPLNQKEEKEEPPFIFYHDNDKEENDEIYDGNDNPPIVE